MRALLWKDVRLNRSLLTLGVVLLLTPYVGALILGAYRGRQQIGPWWGYDEVMRTGFISLVLCLIPMTMLAGNALAREREDRSAAFLAGLPPSRATVLLSKLVVAGGATLVLWAINMATVLGLAPRMANAPAVLVPGVHDDPVAELFYVAAVAVGLFGVAWFFSSWMARASTAIAATLLSPALVFLVVVLTGYLIPLPSAGLAFLWLSLGVGVAAFIAGTVHFVRRFEP